MFDLSSIPLSIIERIEIIKSGSGNLGRTNAIGGIIHIITKKPEVSASPFTLSFENGSFLPVPYGPQQSREWKSLVDSQRLDLSARVRIGDMSVVNNFEGTIARNEYAYRSGSTWDIRRNAEMYQVQDSLSVSTRFGDDVELTSTNLFSYRQVGVPGSLSYGLTPEDRQEDLRLSTAHKLSLHNLSPLIELMDVRIHYGYGRLFYHDAAYVDSTHHNHTGALSIEQQWNVADRYALSTGIHAHLSHLDSSDVDQHTRITSGLNASASIYFGDGRLSVHPSANISYLSDTNILSPDASVGAIFVIDSENELKTSISYAETVPSFNQLYWPFMGNPDLETEKGVNVDVGYAYGKGKLGYESNLFFRAIHNAIAYDSFWIPRNIARSMYVGTEQSVTWYIQEKLKLSASYQYNKSFDLSDDQTLRDNVEVAGIRKHTVKASLSYERGIVSALLDGEYLGRSSDANEVLLVNTNISVQLRESLRLYLAIDNILNISYEFTAGYPMPGMKIRVGGSWDF